MDNSLWQRVVDEIPVSNSYLEAKQELERKKEQRRAIALAASTFLIGTLLLSHEPLLELLQ
eukprot:2053937-Pyramimonas_sp.AAC.2